MNFVKRNYAFPKLGSSFFDDDLFFKWDSLWPEISEQKSQNQDMNIKPKADIVKIENGYLIELEMPGITKDNLKIYTENQYIIIEGNREINKSENKTGYYCNEIRRGNFKRSFYLPSEVDTDPSNISATYKDGILKLILPIKKEEKLEKTINVKFE